MFIFVRQCLPPIFKSLKLCFDRFCGIIVHIAFRASDDTVIRPSSFHMCEQITRTRQP